jgi:hypothetical protein
MLPVRVARLSIQARSTAQSDASATLSRYDQSTRRRPLPAFRYPDDRGISESVWCEVDGLRPRNSRLYDVKRPSACFCVVDQHRPSEIYLFPAIRFVRRQHRPSRLPWWPAISDAWQIHF